MFPGTVRTHVVVLLLVFLVAFLLNSASYFLTGISPAYNQSSDTTVHMVQWQEFSRDYSGNFDNDVMFQNYQAQPTGTLFVDKVLVRISEFLHIGLLDWSIVISSLTLTLFLSGVYFLVFYTTKNLLLSFIITFISIIPVISLGLSGWGILVLGFVPKEISVTMSVWLTILYLQGVSNNSKPKIAAFFALLGLFANWYPPVFFHYALALLTVEVVRQRSIKKEHILYGLLFLAAAPIALYDIFVKAAHFAPPVLAIIIDHYGAPLQSLSYLLVHYLRKQIIYAILIGVLWYIYRRVLKKEYPPLIHVWYAIWWSTLAWSLVGVGIEIFAPLYMKYLISRISVWFYLASMVIVAYTAYEVWFTKFNQSIRQMFYFSALLLLVLLGQTSILSVYAGIKESQNTAEDYKQYLSVVMELKSVVPPGSIIFANPDDGANTIRTYGGFGSYVAAKDGNVTLFDGVAAELWFERYKETQRVFSLKDFSAIQAFAVAHGLQYYFFNKKDVLIGASALAEKTILESGTYGLAKLY